MRGKQTMLGGLVMLLLLGPAGNDGDAADANKRFSVRGVGTTTCSKYLETRNLEVSKSEQYANWLTGFFTAYNWLQPNTYDIAPASEYNQTGLLRFLDLYCGKNPKKKVVDAAVAFVKAIYDKRDKTGP